MDPQCEPHLKVLLVVTTWIGSSGGELHIWSPFRVRPGSNIWRGPTEGTPWYVPPEGGKIVGAN
jgi:hypothetical protein